MVFFLFGMMALSERLFLKTLGFVVRKLAAESNLSKDLSCHGSSRNQLVSPGISL